MFCTRCGKENSETNKFCNGCGVALLVEKSLLAQSVPAPPPPPPAPSKFSPVSQIHQETLPDIAQTLVLPKGIPAITEEIGSKVDQETSSTAKTESFTNDVIPAVVTPESKTESLDPEPSIITSNIDAQQNAPQPVAEPAFSNQVSFQAAAVQRPKRSNKGLILLLSGVVVLIVFGVAGILLWRYYKPVVTDAGSDQPTPDIVKPSAVQPPPDMTSVSGGDFFMGSDDADEFSKPAHKITVRPFYIDVTEVTNEHYKSFVDSTSHNPPPHWVNRTFLPREAKYPVTNVTWDDATAFANWAGKRLPTEEEWEFAARGTDGRIYPWGSDWNSELTNAGATGVVEVATKTGKSPFGCFDMSGNAWEWTASDARPYKNGVPFRRKMIEPKIIRGGFWGGKRNEVTAVYRRAYGARDEKEYKNSGFRCAKDMSAN